MGRRVMRGAWFVCCLLSACGGDDGIVPVDATDETAPDAMLEPPPDLLEQSGSRLKVEWWQTAEGARQVRGIYDSERDEECTFDRRWVDGELYCLPPLATIAYAAAVHDRARLRGPHVRPVRSLRFRRARDRGVHAEWRRVLAGRRERRPGVLRARPLAILPVLTHTPDPEGTDRIRTMYLTHPDGLHQHGGLYDANLDVECSIKFGDDGTPRCLPIPSFVGEVFADAACATTTSMALVIRRVPETSPCSEPEPTLGTYYQYDSFDDVCVEVEGYLVTPVSLDVFVAAMATVDP